MSAAAHFPRRESVGDAGKILAEKIGKIKEYGRKEYIIKEEPTKEWEIRHKE